MNADDPANEAPDPDALASGDDGTARDARRARRRVPRRMTAERLHRIALAYLDRYDTAQAGFRTMLQRRVWKAAQAHGEDPASFEAMIDAEVARMVEAGFLDDRRFAEGQVTAQRARGASSRGIAARLKAKGLEAALVETALAADESDDRAAALRLARRRRLGPFRLRERAERRERDIAALCRAGFGFGLAQAVIDGEGEDG